MLAFTVQITFLATVLMKRKKNVGVVLTLGAFVIVVVGMLIWLGGAELTQRIASIHSEASTELSGSTRVSMDRDALKMFLHRPVLGFGLATFPDVCPEFRSFYTDFIVNAAHNDYLQLLVEMGALGVCLDGLVSNCRLQARHIENNQLARRKERSGRAGCSAWRYRYSGT